MRNACRLRAGPSIFWHCDRDGLYSLYTIPQESYLRGTQVSDENGRLDFVTVFRDAIPAAGRICIWRNFASLADATNGKNSGAHDAARFARDVCADVYGNAKGYEGSRNPFSHVSIAGDVSFGDNTPPR